MKFDWRSIAHVAAIVSSGMVPGAVAIEQGVEAIVDAKSGKDKANMAVDTALKTLNSVTALTGKTLMTPRIEAAIRKLNDDNVELLNALAEAKAAQDAAAGQQSANVQTQG